MRREREFIDNQQVIESQQVQRPVGTAQRDSGPSKAYLKPGEEVDRCETDLLEVC